MAQYPFTVETELGVVGGAETQADAVSLAAALFARLGGFVKVRETATEAELAQLGEAVEPPTLSEGVSLTTINPEAQPSPLQVLVCTGAGFEEGAEILFDEVRQETTFTDPTSVSARVSYSGEPGERCSVQVRNPDGTVSNTLYFTFE